MSASPGFGEDGDDGDCPPVICSPGGLPQESETATTVNMAPVAVLGGAVMAQSSGGVGGKIKATVQEIGAKIGAALGSACVALKLCDPNNAREGQKAVDKVGNAIQNGLNAVRSGSGRAYNSFEAFKYAEGDAGAGMAWHHIVGQQAANVGRFGANAIHNTSNMIRLPHGAGSIHNQITGVYNSIRSDITGSTTLRVREWLAMQSYEFQWKFGVDLIRQLGGEQYIVDQIGK
ncbi:MAG: hypothetical protein HC853_00880 [Anaerolineae bacterium]|nr:hypothetical protein [Anaerolineae bacterium]